MVAPMTRLAIPLVAIGLASPLASQEHPLRALNIEFGIKDFEPTQWDGSLSLDKGEIVDLRGHRFKEGESVGPDHSWITRTDPWPRPTGGMHPHELPFPHVTLVQSVGVTLYYRAPDDATVTVKTINGDFSFKPRDLPPSDAMHILSTRVELRRVPPVEAVTTDEFEDDYAALSRTDDGTLALAWIGYKDEKRPGIRARLVERIVGCHPQCWGSVWRLARACLGKRPGRIAALGLGPAVRGIVAVDAYTALERRMEPAASNRIRFGQQPLPRPCKRP